MLIGARQLSGADVGRALAVVYEALVGPYPDGDAYFRAMVEDRRLLCRVHVEHTYTGGA